MKKRGCFYIFALAIIMIPISAFASSSGESGADFGFTESCTNCHGDSPIYPLLGAALEYETSTHKNGGNSHYSNGGGCQQCHTNEGFIEYTKTGTVEGTVNMPSQPGCFTCHTPHTTGDFSLRVVDPVTLADGSKFDIGAGNLCASCHKSRAYAQELAVPTAANTVRSHWGAHHGPQADVLLGTNAFEYTGRTYSSSKHASLIKDGCAICHMALPTGRYALSPEVGGHSFSIEGEVHEAEVLNVSACVNCHEDIGQVRGRDIFDIAAKEDFDLDGMTEPLQDEVVGLLDALSNPRGTGYLQTLDPPFYKEDGSWNQVTSQKERPAKEMAALYNYKFILEDRSKGVHNPVYTIQVLYDTLKALDSTFDDSLRPE